MDVKYKRKIGYPAGLVSLAFLPILCMGYIYFDQSKQVALEVQYFNSKGYKNNLSYRTNYHRKKHPPKIAYCEVELNGDDVNDRAKLASAQLAIRILVISNDLSRGIHSHFTENAKVWSLVSVFDICNIEKAKIFCPDGNDFWIYNLPQRKNFNKNKFPPIIRCCSVRKDVLPKTESIAEMHSRENLERRFLQQTIQYFWPSAVMFFLMAFFRYRDFQ